MAWLEVYGWGLLGIWGMVTLLWLLSIPLRNVSIVDIFWGTGFVLVNGMYFLLGEGNPDRKWLLLALVSIWGLRLSIYLAWRNIGKGEDFRYQEFRRQYGAHRYWWFSYFQVFLLQGLLMGAISLPLVAGMSFFRLKTTFFQLWGHGNLTEPNPLNYLDYLGIVVWVIGFVFEAGGDWQLARFKANPENKGKVMDRGFWRYTRHPNYFGDAAVWWGFGLIAIASGAWWSAIGSLIMTGLIIKISGVALLEKTLKTQKPHYAEYVRKTSAFFPWFPKK